MLDLSDEVLNRWHMNPYFLTKYVSEAERNTILRDLISRAYKIGHKTGSMAFGFATDRSDLDLVIHAKDFPEIDLKALNVYTKAWLPTLGCRFGKYNLIVCVEEWEYQSWVVATEAMKQMIADSTDMESFLSDKANRVVIFEWLRIKHGLPDGRRIYQG